MSWRGRPWLFEKCSSAPSSARQRTLPGKRDPTRGPLERVAGGAPAHAADHEIRLYATRCIALTVRSTGKKIILGFAIACLPCMAVSFAAFIYWTLDKGILMC